MQPAAAATWKVLAASHLPSALVAATVAASVATTVATATMVQTTDVVCCASCSTFQVQLRGATKKRWSCSLCGTKQSYVRVFASGSAKELRPIVQSLNMSRGTASEEAAAQAASSHHNTYYDNAAWPPQAQENVWQENAWQENAWVHGSEQMGEAWPQAAAADPHDPWGGNAPWSGCDNTPQPPPAFGGFRAAAPAHPLAADESADVYVTQLPARGKRAQQQPPPKRKYGTNADEFLNDPRRQMSEQRFRLPQHSTWQEAQQAAQEMVDEQHHLGAGLRHDMSLAAHGGMHGVPAHAARPPPRSFHAHRPHAPKMATAREDASMYVTSGYSEVVDEEVWQD